jgi:hypothetical protein
MRLQALRASRFVSSEYSPFFNAGLRALALLRCLVYNFDYLIHSIEGARPGPGYYVGVQDENFAVLDGIDRSKGGV